jgi:TolB-like protein
MYTEQVLTNSELFPEDVILKQVEKILSYPLFAASDTLQKFLKYIINETLSGRANQLKEYTIAVYALKKPAGFRPLHDGIVRVHARRLRDALSSYYIDHGTKDVCKISIPKGGYIPVFRSLNPVYSKPGVQIFNDHWPEQGGKMRIAILPFKSFEEANPRLAFTDNIGRMLSAEFVHFTNFSVLSYYTALQIKSENSSVKMIASEYGVQYILVGNVQFEHKKVRVAVQLINTETEMMLWSEIFTHDISISNTFETLDTIVYQIISGLEEFSCHFRKQKSEIQKEIKMEEVINNDIINLRETRRKKTV